jgi:hypothetical protein
MDISCTCVRVGDVVTVAGKVAAQAKSSRPSNEEPLCAIPQDIEALAGTEVNSCVSASVCVYVCVCARAHVCT